MEATLKNLFTILDPYTHQGLSNHTTLSTIQSGATVSLTYGITLNSQAIALVGEYHRIMQLHFTYTYLIHLHTIVQYTVHILHMKMQVSLCHCYHYFKRIECMCQDIQNTACIVQCRQTVFSRSLFSSTTYSEIQQHYIVN